MNASLFWRAVACLVALAAFAGAAMSIWNWQPQVWAGRQLSRAQVQADTGQRSLARATLRELLRRLPMERPARWQVIQLELQDQRLEQAYLEVKAYSELFPDAPEGWLLLARLMNGGGLLDEAEAAADNAVASAPESTQPRAVRAAIRLRRGRFFGAGVDAQAVLAREPGSAAMQDLRSRVHAAMAGSPPAPGRIHRGARGERGERVESHAMVWPGTLAVLRRDSDAAVHANDAALAREVEFRARKLYPGSVIGPWLAGVSAMARDDGAAAAHCFGEALVAAPRSALVATGLAQVWAREGGAADAAQRLMALARADPGFAFARRHAANNYLDARRPDLAEGALREGVAGTRDAGSYRDLATFYLEVDRAGDALAAARDGLARFPADLELQSLAAQLTARGDAAAATAQYEAILKAAPDRTHDAVALANLLLDSSAGAPRVQGLLKQLQFDAPGELDDAAGLGRALLRSGDAALAIPWLEAASQAAPDRADIRYHLAAAYAKAGRKKEALAHLDFALQSGASFSEQPEAQKLRQALRPR